MTSNADWLHAAATPPTADDTERVRASWFDVETAEVDLAEVFYARLFEFDPAVRGLFAGDPAAQRRKFAATLAVVVERLDDDGALVQRLASLGRLHRDVGVEAHHYALVEDALTAALAEVLEARFDTDTAAAWQAVYRSLARAMFSAPVADTDTF